MIERINKEEERKLQVPKNLFIFAVSPPTAGKTTQTIFLSETVRAKLIRGVDVVPQLATNLEASRDLIPDEIFVPALRNILEHEVSSQVVLDNIPRTEAQAAVITEWCKKNGTSLHVVQLTLTEDEVVERVEGRRVCPHCRESYHPLLKPPKTEGVCDVDGNRLVRRQGDRPELVRRAFKEYKFLERDLIGILEKSAKVYQIPASGTVYETAREMFTQISPAIFYKGEMAEFYYKLRDLIDEHKFRHLFFAGMPVFMYEGRALMKDFDILVPNDEIEKIASFLGLEVGEKDSSVAYTRFIDIGPGVETNSNMIVKAGETKIPFEFDFLWEEVRLVRFMGLECPIMGLEDLILFKAALGRFGPDDWGKHKDDLSDIEGLVGSQSVDWDKLNQRAKMLNMQGRLVDKLQAVNIKMSV